MYRKILHISYKNHVTNEEVRAHIQKATEQNENLLTIVKRRKLQRACLPFITSSQNQLARHSEREKKTRQTGRGGKATSGQWTGLEFGKSQRAVGNREKWRKLVAKSSVVPQRPSLLRD